ncbi:F-box/kelch-repeat protein At3g06240-like [Papaver somniferum]|uniref:F-box/kelch-repeat protein At3g06240-like n=1 Tax=Papaver somniferum TaxID=3469 RepID=UPI000E6FD2ED|nr:F-box/kelch-repeat protein At3g06240-like [Papaver somniferum]
MGSRLKKNFNKIFPTEIISDILTRLPTESVLECKLVCKTWMNLIQHSSFPQMHLSRLNHPDSTESGKLRYVYLKSDDDDDDYDRNNHLSYFEFNDIEDWNYVKPIYRKIIFRTKCEAYIIIGSLNGLVCMYGAQPDIPDTRGPAIVFNPVTKEYVVLPEFKTFPEYETKGLKSIEHFHEACGFGYLASTNEYKVVRIYTVRGALNSVEVEEYAVGSGKGWRHVGKFDFGFRFYAHPEQTHGVFLNECLHWRDSIGRMVLVFDQANEKFRDRIPPPPMLTETDDDSGDDG